MRCSCGMSVPFPRVPEDRRCNGCGGGLAFEADDFLLHGANGLVTKPRVGQIEMARLIERLVKEESAGIIEGPVGVGKSFAYMVPSILSGKTIVISTAKKQLQHQLAHKDAPRLATHLEKNELRVALLKGKSNYACRLRALEIPDPLAQREFLAFLEGAETADLTECMAKMGGRPKYWFDVTAEDCIGAQRCKFAAQCGYARMKKQAKTAQVIIANHHVVAFDLKFGPFKLLPKYDVLVIDEAHQAPAAFRGAFGQTVHQMGYMRILRAIDKAGMQTGFEKRLSDVWRDMFEVIRNQDGEIPADPFGPLGDEAIQILAAINKQASDEIKNAGGTVFDEELEDDEDAGPKGDTSRKDREDADWAALASYHMLKGGLSRQLEALRGMKEPDENTVVYITTAGEKKLKTVTVAPINVGPMITQKLQQIPTTIVTSATLSVNGNFDDIKRQLGLDWEKKAPVVPEGEDASTFTPPPKKKVETLVVQSPFDYKRQAVLYTPKHLPLPVSAPREGVTDPAREKYLDAMSTEIARLLRAGDGNAFVLFSATSDLNDMHKRLEDEDLRGIQLIPQGTDAEAALAQFMKTPRSAILGLKSFWEGVDVQGDKLRLVIITKLPFPQMNDPVIRARERQMRNELAERGLSEGAIGGAVFNAIQVPHMITDLRQGVGRLIRSTTDRGVCAILDSRVWSGSGKKLPLPTQTNYSGYGASVVNAIGFGSRTAQFDVVQRFLARIQGEEKAAA